MKKLFSKATKEATGDNQQSFVGKVYVVSGKQYVVEETIAEGGFAIVFLVKAVKSGKKFALKRSYVNNEHDLLVCKREIQIYSTLGSHKNIITYVDSSINKLPNDVYEVLIIMVYYKDSLINQLSEKAANGGYKEAELLTIFCDLCEAVSRLHHCQTPIVHRDLKVENVLLDTDGSCLLCDFGSATSKSYNPLEYGVQVVADDLAKYTTLSYRAPEMVDLYSGKVISTKADIWSLGCLFYRLAYLTPAFSDSTLAIQSGNYNQPTNHNYSPNLVKLIRYMLTVDPDLRPDIFQVSSLVFKMAEKPCPVINLLNTAEPEINNLQSPVKTTQKQQTKLKKTQKQAASQQQTDSNTTTSVRPRERPKASGVSTTPLSLINPATTPHKKKSMGGIESAFVPTKGDVQKKGAKTSTKEKPNEAPKEFSQAWPTEDTSVDNTFQDSFPPPFQPFPPEESPFQTVDQAMGDKKEAYKSTNPFLCSTEVNVQSSPVANIFAEFVASDDNNTTLETTAEAAGSESQQLLDRKHRRNISDTTVSSIMDKKRASAFRAYKNQETQGVLSEDGKDSSNLCIEEAAGDEENEEQPKRPLSADPTSSQDWNPFSDDSLFTMQDKKARGSESSIAGVKSREDLVMSYAEMIKSANTAPGNDPFSAAPLGPLSRMKKLTSKKKSLLEDDASSDATQGYSKLVGCQEEDKPTQLPHDPSTFVLPPDNKQLIITTSSTNVSDVSTVTNTVSKAANMSHDLLAGTARLVKKAVGGASDMYKQFVEGGTEDSMQDVIVASGEEVDAEGSKGFQLLNDMKDMLKMVPNNDWAFKTEATTNNADMTVNPSFDVLSKPASATETVVRTASFDSTDAPKGTFISSIISQFTGSSSSSSSKLSTFQKLKYSEGSHSHSFDSTDVTASNVPHTAIDTPLTTTKKSNSKTFVTSIIKNPFGSKSEKEELALQVFPEIHSSIPPAEPKQALNSTFKNPLKAGLDVFNAAPFRKKKQTEVKKTSTPVIETFPDPASIPESSNPPKLPIETSKVFPSQVTPQAKQENVSSSPMLGYKFSIDSLKFKSSKANFNVLKNENSLENTSKETPVECNTNYKHQEDFADFNSFDMKINNQNQEAPKPQQEKIPTKQGACQKNIETKVGVQKREQSQPVQKANQPFEFKQPLAPKQVEMQFKKHSIGAETFHKTPQDLNIEEEEEEGDDDSGILWNKKSQKKEPKPRSKSLFEQSQASKVLNAESKFNSTLSSPEEETKHSTVTQKSFSNKNKGKYPSSEFANLGFTDDPDALCATSSSTNLHQKTFEKQETSAVAHNTLPRMGSKKKALKDDANQHVKILSDSQGSIETRRVLSISQGNNSSKVTFV